MTETTRTFNLGDLLTAYSGRLLSGRGMDGVYDILNYMTGDNLFTHQLPRAMNECKPMLEDTFPWLETIVIPEELDDWAKIDSFLGSLVAKYGNQFYVPRLKSEDHTHIDALSELGQMLRSDQKMIIVEVPGTFPEEVDGEYNRNRFKNKE